MWIRLSSMDQELWHNLSISLRDRLREAHFSTWQRVTPLRLESDTLHVAVANKFLRDWIQGHFVNDIAAALRELVGRDINIQFEIDATLSDEGPTGETVGLKPEDREAPAQPATAGSGVYSLNPRYTFANFVVGPANQFAHAACQAVAATPAKNYNPLFLYGGVGLGKTHLLNAIGQEMLRRNPATRITYISSEQFINKLVHSIRFDRMTNFRRVFRDDCDLLLIDDIQFIAGKERTQEEFFHTFDKLYNSGKQIVLSSDRSPNDIPGLEERLRSRFQWGLIADIQIPDLETRIAIVNKKADGAKIQLPDDVAYFLAGAVKSNIRELEGALIRLSAFSSLMGQPITIDFAREVLESVISKDNRRLTMDQIQRAVAEYYQIRLPDLLGHRRTRSLALPRQIAMYLCRKHIEASFPEIGNKFGGKDHSTVVHACSKIGKCLDEDETLLRQIRQIEAQLNL